MPSWFKNREQRRFVGILTAAMLTVLSLALFGLGGVWNTYDYKALDVLLKKAVESGHGPKPSYTPQILYLTVTDETYDYFGKHFLDRKDLAELNTALALLGLETVIYDLIFARPGMPDSDAAFARSIQKLESVYLPIGCELQEKPAPFRWETIREHERYLREHLGRPVEKGRPMPYHAVRAVMQQRRFAAAASGAGDINVPADPDSVYRHIPLLVKVDDRFMPALSLSVFLDWAGVTMEDVIVDWGDSLIVPAAGSERLARDVVIPIDYRGRTFVPFVGPMGEDFDAIPVHTLLQYSRNNGFRGNLLHRFEGNFVLIADVAVGISDLGATPIEAAVPLVTLHGAMLNGMLTRTFYRKWSFEGAMAVIFLLGILFGSAAVFRSSWILYGVGFLAAIGLVGLTWAEMIHFRLFPVMTVGMVMIVVFFGLVISLEAATARERAFIRKTFSRYVPETIVNQLMTDPDAVRLGGEERMATVLFSDLADFTSLSENMSPTDLVGLLNEYLTEMTAIITSHGGIIDKFQGDAVMAEFGVPLTIPDHADRAVDAALEMQRRMDEIRKDWSQKGRPALHCRIGINTGWMVVGNMGSKEVLDYTVVGDAVNLASRLEGANKYYDTSLMISEFTREQLTPDRFHMRILDVVQVKGKEKPVKVYEVYAGKDAAINPEEEEYYRIYNDAFEAYLSKDFNSADKGFLNALLLKPEDVAASEMRRRIQAIREKSLPFNWDGSVTLTHK